MAIATAPEAITATPTPPASRPMGRPTLYTDELAENVIGRIEAGYTVDSACKEHGLNDVTFWRWVKEREDFRGMWERARALRAHALAEKTLTISDDEPDPKRAAVRVGARQWMAARLNRAFYGDRQTVEMAGGVNICVSALIAGALEGIQGPVAGFQASLPGVAQIPAIDVTHVNSSPETVNAAVSPMDSPSPAQLNLTNNAEG